MPKSYAQPQPLNETMIGGTVGEVVESRNPAFAVGDKVVGMGLAGSSTRRRPVAVTSAKMDTTHIPLSAYLGVVGMPGMTAWYGLNKICEPRRAKRCVSMQRPAPSAR